MGNCCASDNIVYNVEPAAAAANVGAMQQKVLLFDEEYKLDAYDLITPVDLPDEDHVGEAGQEPQTESGCFLDVEEELRDELQRSATISLLSARGSVEQDKIIERLDLLRIGAVFKKKNRYKPSRTRYFWVPSSLDRLCWGKKNKNGQMRVSKHVNLTDIEGVERKGRKIVIKTTKTKLEISTKNTYQLEEWEDALKALAAFELEDLTRS